jgi:hypothetical protein
MPRFNCFKIKQANKQIQKPDDYVHTVKPSSKVETTSELPVRECKRLALVFTHLHVTKQYT